LRIPFFDKWYIPKYSIGFLYFPFTKKNKNKNKKLFGGNNMCFELNLWFMPPFLSLLLLASLAIYSFENFEIWLLKYPPQKKTLENWLLIFFEYLFFIIFLNHHLAKKNSKEKKRKERGTFFKKYTHKTIFVFCCFLFLFCCFFGRGLL